MFGAAACGDDDAGADGQVKLSVFWWGGEARAKLTELVTTSPELTSALQDPAVLELLARPEIRAEFGEMLKRTAADQKVAQAAAAKAQAEAAAKAAAPPPPPPSDPPPAA